MLGMQEFMMEQMQKARSHTFLTIYLNADNLYPNMCFSPAGVRGIFCQDGQKAMTVAGISCWSEKAQGDDDGACFAALRDVRRKI